MEEQEKFHQNQQFKHLSKDKQPLHDRKIDKSGNEGESKNMKEKQAKGKGITDKNQVQSENCDINAHSHPNLQKASSQKNSVNNSQNNIKSVNSSAQNSRIESTQKRKRSTYNKSDMKNKRKNGQKQISQYDKLEEMRFKSYETSETLTKLVSIIEQQSQQNEEDCFSANFLFTVDPEVWEEIRTLANQSQNQFSGCSSDWEAYADQLTQELIKYKSRCRQLKDQVEMIKSESYSQSRDQQKEYELTLKNIAQAYNKNRTQVFNVMDEMELAMHDLKNGLEKRNVKQLTYMTQLDRDMDEMLIDFISKSGRVMIPQITQRGNSNGVDSSRNKGQNNVILNSEKSNNVNSLDQQDSNPQYQLPPQNSGRRGRSQQPLQSKVEIISQQTASNPHQKVNIPLLPIHKINDKKQPDQYSSRPHTSRGGQQMNNQQQSARGTNQQQQNMNGALSSRQQVSARVAGQQVSAREMAQKSSRNQQTPRQIDSSRSKSAMGEIQGGIIDGEYLVNPVFLGAAYQTSQFDRNLENDFEGAEQTLPFETDRLKQYEDEYNALQSIEDENQRILFKQMIFFAHEKELKGQVKEEQQKKMMLRRQQRQQSNNNQRTMDGTTPRVVNGKAAKDENEETCKEQMNNRRNSNSSQNNDWAYSLQASHISLQKQLPLICTQELISARRKEVLKDVELSQLMDVSVEIEGLIKTVTEKDLIIKIEQEFKKKEELLKDDRRVLEWSSDDDINSVNEQDKKDRMSQKQQQQQQQQLQRVGSQESNNAINKNRLYSNGAINIVDMQNQELSNKVVGELGQNDSNIENEQYSSSCLSLNSSEILEQYKQKQQQEQREFLSPNSDVDLQLSPDDTAALDQQQQEEQRLPKVKPLQSLEIIHERQSEFSSSINTNRFMQKLNSNRSKSRQQISKDHKLLDGNQVQLAGKRPHHHAKIQSARENHAKQTDDLAYSEANKARQIEQYKQDNNNSQQDIREEKYKRCKSHRQSLQSAPNSQRSKIVHQKEQDEILVYSQYNKNFHSIQVDESYQADDCNDPDDNNSFNCLAGIQYKKQIKQAKHSYENSYNNLISMDVQQSQRSSAVAAQVEKGKKDQQKNSNHNNNNGHAVFDMVQKFSPPNELNQFEESKTSSFKNESFDLENSQKFQKREALSDYDYRENEDMCDMDDIDLNQVQIYNKMIPLSYLKDMQNYSRKVVANGGGFNSLNQNTNHFASQSNQSSIIQNLQQSRALSNNHQMTANMLNNYLQNQTYLKGNSTRDVNTFKRHGDQRGAPQGQTGFTLSNFGDETLFYMFPAQKTQRRTLFMLQNFNNNYYNNCAGVLFTMPFSGEMNNGFLQQSSTVPSDPEAFCSGGMTIQDAQVTVGENKTKKLSHHQQNINTQDSLSRDDNILQGLQRFCMPQFIDNNKKLSMSKNALSTNDSAFKSTNLPTRFNIFQNKQDQTLSPKISMETEHQTKEFQSLNTHFDPFNKNNSNYSMNTSSNNVMKSGNIFQRSKHRAQQQQQFHSQNNNQSLAAKDAFNPIVLNNYASNVSGPQKINKNIFQMKSNPSTNNSFVVSSSSELGGGPGSRQQSSEKPKAVFNRNIKIIYNSAQSHHNQNNSSNANNGIVLRKSNLNLFKKGSSYSTNNALDEEPMNQNSNNNMSYVEKKRRESFPIKF